MTACFDSTGPAPDGARHVGPRRESGAPGNRYSRRVVAFSRQRRPSPPTTAWVQRWRYDWDGGHVRGVDLFKLRDGRITEKLSYVKG